MSTKDLVLKSLRNAGGSFVSGETLSGDLHVSRTAIWKAIRALREEGYIIKAVTNRGYRLIEGGDTIAAGNIRDFLPSEYKSIDIEVYDILDSTNLKARQLSDDGASHGTVVIALQQTAGRGRLGRDFFSPREGLYLSIIIKPSFALDRAAAVTTAVAVAVAEAVEKVCGKQAGIKWVNDIYCDGKKICGILTEGITNFETGRVETMIIGIGVNTTVKDFPEELLDIAGAVEGNYSKAQLAAEIIAGTLRFIGDQENSTFIDSYKQRSIVLGRDITVYKGRYLTSPEKDLSGIPAKALDIDNAGRLIVQYENGTREALSSGEISIRL